jgi:hypothetical protein
MNDVKVYAAVVDKEHILKKDIKPVVEVIDSVSLKEKLSKGDPFQKIAITISGYDNTADELWEIPEVRVWANRLINKIPYLFYYIENEFYQTQQTLMLCMNDYEAVFAGEKKSPDEYGKEGVRYDQLPQSTIKIHVHRKSMHEMFSEVRKHAKTLNKPQNAIKLVSEMSQRYGVGKEEE